MPEPHDAFELEVDGERFLVRHRAGSTDTFDYTWLSGPNPGYGFTSASNSPSRRTESEHVRDIRGFLGAVDPTTGYIE